MTSVAPSGAHSWVRKSLDIDMDGDQTGKPFRMLTHPDIF